MSKLIRKNKSISSLQDIPNTILFVVFPMGSMTLFGFAKIRVVYLDTPLGNATLSCPCKNTRSRRLIPTVGTFCPGVLLMEYKLLAFFGSAYAYMAHLTLYSRN
jgi:hypothetical protein